MKKVMRYLFLTCHKSTELIEKRSVFGLSRTEKVQLMFHKMMCTACTQFDKQSRLLDEYLHEKGRDIKGLHSDLLSQEYKDAIKSRLENG
ncbi:MAG: hypothetical protein GVY19_05795 [Bacteroidetes bacterium]|jgi:hypothetical protein|nr:hypothetical protein [Bacteroidota bacterium]